MGLNHTVDRPLLQIAWISHGPLKHRRQGGKLLFGMVRGIPECFADHGPGFQLSDILTFRCLLELFHQLANARRKSGRIRQNIGFQRYHTKLVLVLLEHNRPGIYRPS